RDHAHRPGPAGRPLHRWHQARDGRDRLPDPGPALPRDRHQGQGRHPGRLVPRSRERLVAPTARSKARKRAVDVLFEASQRGIDPVTLLADRIVESGTQTALPQYSVDIVEGVTAQLARIDEALETYAQGWTLDRMPAVDLAILRVATWEILSNDEVDDPVAIDEAVELARSLSTDDSPAFVNGLLGRIARLKAT